MTTHGANHRNSCPLHASISPGDKHSIGASPRLGERCVSAGVCKFLELPGEIRNQIYRATLLSTRPFAVQLQFWPRDAALLRVNKQIYVEASSIFYHENMFRFPQPLFLGPPILCQLEMFYKLCPTKLQTLRNIMLDIPVSSHLLSQI